VRKEYSIPERLGGFGIAVAGAASVWPAFNAGTGLGLPCPLRWATGIPCPACGLTTAAVDLAHGRLAASLGDNPAALALAVLTAVMVPLVVLRYLGLAADPVPWSARARRRTYAAAASVAAASWIFQLHRFGLL
jgi:hypothetical protein